MSIYLYIYIDLDSSLSIIDNDESKQIICDQISVPPFFLPRHPRRGLALNQSDGTAKQRQWTQGTKGMGQNMWNLRLIPNCSDYALTILDLENVAPHFLISGKKWSIKLPFFFVHQVPLVPL